MRIYKEEIFGPVLSVVRAKDFEEATQLINDHEFGNGTSIYTRDGDVGRTFASKIKIGMVGINIPIPVPVAYHSFGGWKRSLFGDQHIAQHGLGLFGGILNAAGQMHAALKAILERAFAATAGVDLAFHHHLSVACIEKFFDGRFGFVDRGGRFTQWHADAMAFHQLFGLIFVEIHE